MSEKSERTPDQHLNDLIDAAIAGGNEPEAKAQPETERKPDQQQDSKPEPDDGAPVGRDEKGRFAKKHEPEEKAAPDTATASPVAPVVDESKTDQQKANADAARTWEEGQFRGWSKEQRTRFEALPPEQQDAVMAYKSETDAVFTKRDQEFSQFRKDAEPLVELAKTNRDLWAAQNLTPAQALQGYANIERTLSFGSYDQKVRLISDICKAYSIPFDAQMMTLDMDVDAYRRQHDAQSEIARVQADNARLQQQFESYRAEQLQSHITSFASATNADGTPKYPLFETVKASMGAALSSGQAQTLEAAYDIATKPINEAIAAREAALKAQTQQQQRDAVEKAKRAAPVKASPSLPAGQQQTMSLDDAISAAMAKAGW